MKAGPEVDPNFDSIKNAVLDEVRTEANITLNLFTVCFHLLDVHETVGSVFFVHLIFIDAEEDENKRHFLHEVENSV